MNEVARISLAALLFFALGAPLQASEKPEKGLLHAVPFPVPGGEGGTGFDDLVFAPGLRKLLVPGGRTGRLFLIDPAKKEISSIAGFSARPQYRGGHGDGTTSADEGEGFLFVADRNAGTLSAVDPASGRMAASVSLGGGPDYVRYVGLVHEIWVTEPDGERIEVFGFSGKAKPAFFRAASIPVPGGPESLVIDSLRGRAYTHLWEGSTVAVDVRGHALVSTWTNGCSGSRGIALDEKRGFLFTGCAEGKAVVLDVAHDGRALGSLPSGSGVDVIAYDPVLAHLYIPRRPERDFGHLGRVPRRKPLPVGHCGDRARRPLRCGRRRGGDLDLRSRSREAPVLEGPLSRGEPMTVPLNDLNAATDARRGSLYAVTAAVLFGASTPAVKILLGGGDPWLIAGLLYVGSGLGLAGVRLFQRVTGWKGGEVSLCRGDWGWMAGSMLFGGLLAPVLLMVGVSRTEPATASLLLNVEGVFTASLAWLFFREAFNRRVLAGLALMFLGSVVLTWLGPPRVDGFLGPLCIAGACLAWALDNNLTRRIADRDALQIAMVKGLAAGAVNVGLALAVGRAVFSVKLLAGAGLVGFLGYGVSLLCFVLALRHVGAARAGAWFSLAPFIGAVVSVSVGAERVSGRLVEAALLLGAGAFLFTREST